MVTKNRDDGSSKPKDSSLAVNELFFHFLAVAGKELLEDQKRDGLIEKLIGIPGKSYRNYCTGNRPKSVKCSTVANICRKMNRPPTMFLQHNALPKGAVDIVADYLREEGTPPPTDVVSLYQLRLGDSPEARDRREQELFAKATLLVASNTPSTAAGWKFLDAARLVREELAVSRYEIAAFFDGRIPYLRHALTPGIPEREKIEEIVKYLNDEVYLKQDRVVVVLSGPTGEGKSMALLQILCRLVRQKDRPWQVLFREDGNAPLPSEIASNSGTPLLVAIDKADSLRNALYRRLEEFNQRGVRNVHFLLVARDSDWEAAKSGGERWQLHATVTPFNLQGLSLADAQRIVGAWEEFDALGALKTKTREDAARELHRLATLEAAHPDGAFLGAMLQLRKEGVFDEFVASILEKLRERTVHGIPGLTDLQRAFAYIVFPHAEDDLPVSKQMLATVFGCSLHELQSHILTPLGREAAVDDNERIVRTRHRSIAHEARRQLLGQVDREQIFVDLVRAVEQIKVNERGTSVPDLPRWRFLSRNYFERGEKAFGVKLARAAAEEHRSMPHLVVNLAHLLGGWKGENAAIDEFEKGMRRTRVDRGYLREWGACLGRAGRHSHDAWIVGASLADDPRVDKPFAAFDSLRFNDAYRGFNNLSLAFQHLAEAGTPPDPDYHRCALAAASLGVALLANGQARSGFLNSLETADQRNRELGDMDRSDQTLRERKNTLEKGGIQLTEKSDALFRLLLDGLVAVGKQSGTSYTRYVQSPERMTFKQLENILNKWLGSSQA